MRMLDNKKQSYDTLKTPYFRHYLTLLMKMGKLSIYEYKKRFESEKVYFFGMVGVYGFGNQLPTISFLKVLAALSDYRRRSSSCVQ